MPVCRKLLKFAISTETSYSPAIRRGASKYPLAFVTSCCETLVPVLVIFTSAPGSTPSLSRTVPEIVPRVSWAPTGMVVRHISRQAIPTHFCMGSTLVFVDKNSDGRRLTRAQCGWSRQPHVDAARRHVHARRPDDAVQEESTIVGDGRHVVVKIGATHDERAAAPVAL